MHVEIQPRTKDLKGWFVKTKISTYNHIYIFVKSTDLFSLKQPRHLEVKVVQNVFAAAALHLTFKPVLTKVAQTDAPTDSQ